MWTDLWDCTAGSFHWHYDIDETILVLAVITDKDGTSWPLLPNGVVHFHVGARARWHVPNYVRKIAFCSEPMRRPIAGLLRVKNRIRNLAIAS